MPGDLTVSKETFGKAAAAVLAAFLSLLGAGGWSLSKLTTDLDRSESQFLQSSWTLEDATAYARELRAANPGLVVPEPLIVILDQ